MEIIKNRMWRLGPIFGVIAALLGLTVLAGWYMGLNFITAIRADYIPMAPSTALLFVLSGVGLVIRNLNIHTESSSRIEQSIALTILSVGILIFVLSVNHIHSSWEYLGLSINGFVGEAPIGHMSLITAICFIAVAISLLSAQNISVQHPYKALFGMGLAIAFMLLCLAFSLAYLFGVPLLYDGLFIPPALNTLIGFLFLAVALFDTYFQGAQLCDNWLGKLAKNSATFVWAFIGGVAFIVSVAYAYQRQYEIDFDEEAVEQITAIASLKSHEIQLIRKEWQEDAQTILHAQHVAKRAQLLVNNNADEQVREDLLEVLLRWKTHSSYDEAFFFDQKGNRLISTMIDNEAISSNITAVIAETVNLRRLSIYDFYQNEIDDKVYLATLLPIISIDGIKVGTIVFRIDPHQQLYPLIQQWPVVSKTAETLLVRRDKSNVLFLNDLRFKDDTALRLRHSMENKALPAVMAVEGFTGVVEGLDYRDMKVIADVRAIPDSPWFMVTRIDRSEVYGSLNGRMWLHIALVLSMIFVLGMGLTFLWRQQRLTYYKEQYQTALRLEIYGQAFAQNSEGIMVTDAEGNLTLVNDAFTMITGYTGSEVLGKNPRLLNSGRHDDAFYQKMWADVIENGSWQGEIWNRSKSGKIYPEWLTISALYEDDSDTAGHYIGVFSDITQHKEDEKEINYLAHYDALTGLPNRALLDDRIKQSIRISRRSKRSFAIIFLDLDHFKHVNDSLGHHIGDLMLIDVANRLMAIVREEDTVSRLGGDEYVLLLQETNAAGAAGVAQKINTSIAEPFILEGNELIISPSIGIALYPIDGNTPSKLLQAADSAMYQAKDSGRNQFQFFTEALFESTNRRNVIDNALRGAIDKNELELYYQPQLNIKSGKLIGCEALLRWKHSKLGQVSPGEFIPVAESSGQILAIDRWVLFQAAKQMAAWKKDGILDFTIAVNLSANQFHNQDLLAMVKVALDEYSLSVDNLELELTEGLMMNDVESAITIIDRLHEKGIKLSIDDFGTGYSSLSYLKRFKIDKLKIDQSFVSEITTDKDDIAIVKAIVALADSMGLKTIAEGVETKEQQDLLIQIGCNEVQGYLHSKPLPVAEFEEFIAALKGA
jgi:diguanylate cyclase (GGDEF)-like protein/PAS domain S-box-containing protein